MIHSFSIRIDVSSLLRKTPHQSERNSHSVWIRWIAESHSEWYRAIPCSVRMIPCHCALSPNDSVAHSNGLDSEWFGNRFRLHTESHGTIFIPNESETCIRVDTALFVYDLTSKWPCPILGTLHRAIPIIGVSVYTTIVYFFSINFDEYCPRKHIGPILNFARDVRMVESNETENWYSRVRLTWRSNVISYTTCMQYCQVALFTYKPINSLV